MVSRVGSSDTGILHVCWHVTLLLGKGKRVMLACDLIVGEGEEGDAVM